LRVTEENRVNTIPDPKIRKQHPTESRRDKVRLVGELGQGTAGRYLWVNSLEVCS
jgi:hypothetical protein